jgi:4-hydroxy-3-methylbut-2-enyl diphosphate reductase
VDEVDEVPTGAVLVFSAHGVSPAVVAAAEARGLNTIDATCPLVTKVHREVQRFAKEGYDILLVGHEGHEEVEGTAGEAPEVVQVVDGDDSIAATEIRDPNKVIWLSQTTLSVDETMQTVLKLREKYPTLQNPPSDDICYATQNRQVAIKKVGAASDLVLVVGSANSSNTVRLVEVALEAGAKAAYRIDYASEIQDEWFDGVATIGVSSGASVPEELVEEVLEYISKRDFGNVEVVQTAEEDVQFSLPAELRKELKAAGEDVSNKQKR